MSKYKPENEKEMKQRIRDLERVVREVLEYLMHLEYRQPSNMRERRPHLIMKLGALFGPIKKLPKMELRNPNMKKSAKPRLRQAKIREVKKWRCCEMCEASVVKENRRYCLLHETYLNHNMICDDFDYVQELKDSYDIPKWGEADEHLIDIDPDDPRYHKKK